MQEQWYYGHNGERHGPVSLDALKQLAASGQLLPTDLVWKAEMPSWASANTVCDFPDAPPPFPRSIGATHADTASQLSYGSRSFLEFLDFDFTRFVTTAIVKWVWKAWLILAALLLVLGIVGVAYQGLREGGVGFIVLIVILGFWTVGVRIWLEVVAVIFRIAEYLRDMSIASSVVGKKREYDPSGATSLMPESADHK